MTHTLVAYASKHGSTEEVARAIGTHLSDAGHHVDVRDAEAVTDVEPYDAVVLGASLYMGRVHTGARTFLGDHHSALEQRRLAVFALGPRTLEAHQVADSLQQLRNVLTRFGVEPQFVTVFGGAVDPAKLRFPLNHLPKSDARDWSQIAAWADDLALGFADHAHAETV